MEIINRRNLKHAVAALLLAALAVPASAQVMRKDARKDKKDDAAPGVTFRMKEFYEPQPESDANLMWMRVIYRQIDLTKAENMPLYYPEEPTEDQQSLFRIILGLVTSGQVLFDLAWGYRLYQKALSAGEGTRLKIWDDPCWK